MSIDNAVIQEFLDKKNVIAVVGVSRNPKKYGNRVFHDLLEAGYKVYAVHVAAGMVGEHKCYASVTDLPEKPDVVNLVVPHQVTEKVVRECKELGVTKIWMQPGSESEDAIEYCNENNMAVLHDVCIMVEKTKLH